MFLCWNALKIITDNYWSEDNPDPYAFWPRLSTYGINNNEQPSTWWLRDGDFLRLKSVELGYTIPGRIGSFFDNVNARVYLTGLNLLNFSKIYPESAFYGAEPYVNSYVKLLQKIYKEKINNIKIWPHDIRLIISDFKNAFFNLSMFLCFELLVTHR